MTPTILDYLCYPHIVDQVVESLPRESLIALRQVNRELKDRADAALCKHVYIVAVNHPFRRGFRPGQMDDSFELEVNIYDGTPCVPPYDDYRTMHEEKLAGSKNRTPGLRFDPKATSTEREECLRLLTAHTRIVDYNLCGERWWLKPFVSPVVGALANGDVRTVRSSGEGKGGLPDLPAPTLICFSLRITKSAVLDFRQRMNTPSWGPGTSRLVCCFSLDGRDIRVPHAMLDINLSYHLYQSIREIVVHIDCQHNDRVPPDTGYAQARLRPDRRLGPLTELLTDVAQNLPRIRWTLVGFTEPILHPIPEKPMRDKIETFRRFIHEQAPKYNQWGPGELDAAVDSIAFLQAHEYEDLVGPEQFQLERFL